MRHDEPYSKVFRRMWGDKGFKALSTRPSAQLLWLYLLTGPDCTVIPGLLPKMGIGTLADRLGWPYTAVKKCWSEVSTAEMAEADWGAGLIWLPNGIAYNPPANPNVVTSWRTVVLPDCVLVERALTELRARLAIRESKGFLAAFDELYAKRFPDICAQKPINGSGNGFTLLLDETPDGSQNGPPNQDQDQDQDSTPLTPLAGGLDPSTRKPSKAEEDWASGVRQRSRSGCPHEDEGGPRCTNWAECEGRIVMRKRSEVHKGMQRELSEAAS